MFTIHIEITVVCLLQHQLFKSGDDLLATKELKGGGFTIFFYLHNDETKDANKIKL